MKLQNDFSNERTQRKRKLGIISSADLTQINGNFPGCFAQKLLRLHAFEPAKLGVDQYKGRKIRNQRLNHCSVNTVDRSWIRYRLERKNPSHGSVRLRAIWFIQRSFGSGTIPAICISRVARRITKRYAMTSCWLRFIQPATQIKSDPNGFIGPSFQ